jgi:hypothetical protein
MLSCRGGVCNAGSLLPLVFPGVSCCWCSLGLSASMQRLPTCSCCEGWWACFGHDCCVLFELTTPVCSHQSRCGWLRAVTRLPTPLSITCLIRHIWWWPSLHVVETGRVHKKRTGATKSSARVTCEYYACTGLVKECSRKGLLCLLCGSPVFVPVEAS